MRVRISTGTGLTCILACLLGSGCTKHVDRERSQAAVLHPAALDSPMGRMAQDIAQDVGNIRELNPEGTPGPVFIFEEYHTSRIGQLQIATMLLRLHDRHRLRAVGLEGHMQAAGVLNAAWFHQLGGAAGRDAREDVAVRMVSDGEISAAEFMALLFPDVQVHGLERIEEYQVELDAKGNPELMVLAGIAEKRLTQAQIRRVSELFTSGKQKEAIDLLLSSDAWVKERFEALKNPPASLETINDRFRELREKARELGVNVAPETMAELDKSQKFFQTASQRSLTMTERQLELARRARERPIAMIIGAAHSARIVDTLRARRVAFALLQPRDLNPEDGSLTLEQFERKNQNQWVATAEGMLGRILNAKRKPRPMIETATARSYASAMFAMKRIAEAAQAGKRIPDDVRAELDNLPECRVAWNTCTQDGRDVIFSAQLVKTDGAAQEAWFRVGTIPGGQSTKSLEEKLLARIPELGGGQKGPPRGPPSGNDQGRGQLKDKDDGAKDPADREQNGKRIVKIGFNILGVVGRTKSEVSNVGRISG